MELEPSPVTGFEPVVDRRLRMPEPPPVRLVSVDDVRLPAPAGAERELDEFYVLLLGFEREDGRRPRPRPRVEPLPGADWRGDAPPPPWVSGLRNPEAPARTPVTAADDRAGAGQPGDGPVYRAENFRLRFQTVEPPVSRETLRAQGIEVRSLAQAEAKLIEAEIEYRRERGLVPGREYLLVQDPAGNWVELVEAAPA